MSSIKEVKDSCNCIWKHCEHHKNGAICPNDAIGFDCGHCSTVHWLGDKSLGYGFRLCVQCAGTIMMFVGDEIPHLMQGLAPFVPDNLKCLEAVLKDHYLSYIHMEKSDELIDENHLKGWRNPIRDSRAVLEFSGLILKDKKGKDIPVEVLEEGVRVARKHKDLIEAFSDIDEKYLLKEEIT